MCWRSFRTSSIRPSPQTVTQVEIPARAKILAKAKARPAHSSSFLQPDASFVLKNMSKENNADRFRLNTRSDLQATLKQECTLRITQFMRCSLIMSCMEWFVTNSFGVFCGFLLFDNCDFEYSCLMLFLEIPWISTDFKFDIVFLAMTGIWTMGEVAECPFQKQSASFRWKKDAKTKEPDQWISLQNNQETSQELPRNQHHQSSQQFPKRIKNG